MPRAIDLTGMRFERLAVTGLAPKRGKKRIWECVCDCGATSYAQTSDLTAGKHRSCGCLQIERVVKHGFTRGPAHTSPTYRSWQSMKERCLNPKTVGYHHYGGRGISVCGRWASSFEAFLADVGERPSLEYSLDRIDNSGNYEPGNCRWATRKEQSANKRPSIPPPRPRDPITGRWAK